MGLHNFPAKKIAFNRNFHLQQPGGVARIVPLEPPPGTRLCAERQPKPTNILITMKLIKVISLGLVALFLGACASKQPPPSQTTSVPTTSTSTTHYPSK